jgi:hypothetical protein
MVPQHVLASLADFGEAGITARLHGTSVTDERFSWGNFFEPVSKIFFGGSREQLIEEIFNAARGEIRQPFASIGGYLLLFEFEPGLKDERFLSMQDRTLDYLHSIKASSVHLTRYEADRWIECHGDLRTSFDGIYEVAVPGPPEASPDYKPLEPGQSRLLARMGPADDDNRFFGEHRADGKFIAYSERAWSDDDPTLKRYEEAQLGNFDTLPDLLRALGSMFGTPTYWADEDLAPYFPSRRD